MISPFQETRSEGNQHAAKISVDEYLEAVRPIARKFAGRVVVSLDANFLAPEVVNTDRIVDAFEEVLGDMFVFVGSDPLHQGMIRVTLDGKIMSPFQSVNTADYTEISRKASDMSLVAHWDELLQHVA
jgi:hypothetical protein